MGHTYSPARVFPTGYVVPDDGDPKTASSVNIGLEALGDRTEYLFYRGGRQVADYAAIKAILAPVDGDRVYCIFGGDWVFKTAGAGPDTLFNLVPNDATPGAWVASAYTGILGFANGIPYMAGGKVKPAFLPYAPIFEDAQGPVAVAQSNTTLTPADVAGLSMAIAVEAGDVVIVHASATLQIAAHSPAAVATWSTIVIEAGFGATHDIVAGNVDPQNYSHTFKYVANTTTTITVKATIVTSQNAVSADIKDHSACLHVRVVRP